MIPMDLPNLVVLDVGHGNCAVLSDTKGVMIVDAGQKDTLLQFLEQHGIIEISAIFISHADDDHIAGVPSLLLDKKITVQEVYINPDSGKQGKHWKAFRSAIKVARQQKGTKVNTQLTTVLNGKLKLGSIDIEVLAPEPEYAVSGPEGIDLEGKKLTSNAMSAVIRLVKDSTPLVVLAGDIENRSIETWLSEDSDSKAQVLVFPHHGGKLHPSKTSEIVSHLCKKIEPECVIFSNGREKHDTPRKEVIETILSNLPDVNILCTQLSEHCASEILSIQPSHLNELPSTGAYYGNCCAGSITIDLSKSKPVVNPNQKCHRDFIKKAAPTALCIRG